MSATRVEHIATDLAHLDQRGELRLRLTDYAL
jgi:hypothetical protein